MSSTDKENSKIKLIDLVNRFEQVRASQKELEFSEADVSSKFILPLLDILGWDINDIEVVKEQRRTLSGPADYTLSVNRKPRLIVELKKFTENLDGYRDVHGRRETFPEQATRYAWHLKVEWVVLTNFKEVRLYNSYYKKPSDGLRLKINYASFVSDFETLWIISQESVALGELEKIERKAERENIDKAVLKDLLEIRRLLSENIKARNPLSTLETVKENVQRIMDRLLIVRVSEDRGLIGFESLYKELDSWKSRGLPTPFMRSLKNIFRDFDDVYNTSLFEAHPCEDLSIDNDVLETIMDILYQYNFDLISADVLGAIYEDYLGHILEEITGGGVQIAESKRARKKKGIYYTPTHLVEYVVRATLGELLRKCNSPEDVSKIKILDPACGSGSFLIKAFDTIKEWYDSYNRGLVSKSNNLESHFKTITDVDHRILTENLFGVDIDPQAAEIASVNLMLKAIRSGQKLPRILGQNIKIGNSLVSGTEDGYEKCSDEAKRGLRPFRWDKEFPDVFNKDGFNVIIGNPPYFKVRRTNPIRISPSFDAIKTGPVNVAMMFIHRAIELTGKGGYIGLVLPKMLTYTKGWKGSREEIFKTRIRSLVDCQEAFEKVLLEQILMIVEKNHVDETSSYLVGEVKGANIEISSKHISQNLAKQDGFLFLEPTETAYGIRQKMLNGTVQLGSICDIILGQGIQSLSCWRDTASPKDMRILRGDDVQMWHIQNCLYFSPDDPEVQSYRSQIEQLSVPHIVAQRIVAHIRYPKPHIILMAAYDEKGAFAFNTVVNILVTDPNYDYRYILSLLNSKLLSYHAHRFIYNNAVRSMDFYKDYAGRLPVRIQSGDDQKELIDIVDSIIDLFKEPDSKAPKYESYLTEGVTGSRFFNDYYRQLNPSDRDPRDATTEGMIRNLCAVEDKEWLSFRVDYIDQRHRKIVTDYEVLRCRFKDPLIRTFLLNDINKKGPSNRGTRLLDKILFTKISKFSREIAQDEQLIGKQMEPYMKDYSAHKNWKENFSALDDKLNKKIYSIYGLNEEEIIHVDENSRPTGWHSD
jgi:type I restriction-modification system DNA methylase subunit